MSGTEQVGTVTPLLTRGAHATCAICSWSSTKPNVAEATKILRSHVSLTHPVSIAIYREDVTP